MFRSRVDPVTFEVLRHRLWNLNNEAAIALKRVSGSPVATEIQDFNTSLCTADGQNFMVGPYIVSHGVSQGLLVETLLKDYQENPGIHEGDIFLSSDPYQGAMHQNDVTCLAPIHWQGELIAWAGSTIHEIDVGGPVLGSQASIGAKSIFGEGPPLSALKIVEGGTFRKDVEREYLLRSRTRELNALDLRAKIAATHVAKTRLQGLVEKYGIATVKAVMEDIVDYTEARLRARLRELPDGVFRHTSYLDYDDGAERKIYPCHITLTKEGDGLVFDFAGTAAQAPAVINCAYSGLVSGVVIAVLVHLCYDAPWCPAGVLRVIRIDAEPGTIAHASWPAGVSKATTAGSYTVTHTASACITKMFLTHEDYRKNAMAAWMGPMPTQELFGVDAYGEPFGLTLLDGMAGGTGAFSDRDGIDTGGFLRSLSATISNIETLEARYPILYLYRRQEMDTGGAGAFRGGVGLSTMYTPHLVEEIHTTVLHSHCVMQPEAVGICGGLPSATNEFAILRGSDVCQELESGRVPGGLESLKGDLEIPPPLCVTSLKRGDVYRCISTGGGGYGDPLLREPASVLNDVLCGLVSLEAARTLYGVVLDAGDKCVDQAATSGLREKLREARRAGASLPRAVASAEKSSLSAAGPPGPTASCLGEYLTIRPGSEGKKIVCRACRQVIGPAGPDFKEHLLHKEMPLQVAGPKVDPHGRGEVFSLHAYFCPSCLIQVQVEVALKEGGRIPDIQPVF
ncbi:MAG: hydantoinase B/oxoprolinase family protein [Nitrospinota bacterium]